MSQRVRFSAPASIAASQAGERVAGVVAVAVEEVLGVVDDPLALAAQKATESAIIARFSSRETFVTFSRCRPQVLPTRVTTGVKASTSVRRSGSSSAARPRRRVIPKAQIVACSELELGELGEELDFLRVGAGEAGLDHLHAERVEGEHDARLLRRRERHALALHAVTQGRVVELYLVHLAVPFELGDRGVGTGARLRGESRASR